MQWEKKSEEKKISRWLYVPAQRRKDGFGVSARERIRRRVGAVESTAANEKGAIWQSILRGASGGRRALGRLLALLNPERHRTNNKQPAVHLPLFIGDWNKLNERDLHMQWDTMQAHLRSAGWPVNRLLIGLAGK
ncbi:hypothetical protein TMatcc_010013 [Talaromyces marneffei ATCC 18224]